MKALRVCRVATTDPTRSKMADSRSRSRSCSGADGPVHGLGLIALLPRRYDRHLEGGRSPPRVGR